jgi:hypothetical protein
VATRISPQRYLGIELMPSLFHMLSHDLDGIA